MIDNESAILDFTTIMKHIFLWKWLWSIANIRSDRGWALVERHCGWPAAKEWLQRRGGRANGELNRRKGSFIDKSHRGMSCYFLLDLLGHFWILRVKMDAAMLVTAVVVLKDLVSSLFKNSKLHDTGIFECYFTKRNIFISWRGGHIYYAKYFFLMTWWTELASSDYEISKILTFRSRLQFFSWL